MDTDFQKILDKLHARAHGVLAPPLSEETYVLAIESVFNMVVITNTEGLVQYANPAVERITGFQREEILGKKVGLWGGIMNGPFYKNLWDTIARGEVYKGEIQNHRKNGDIYTARVTISPIKKNKKVIGFIGTEEDITLEKKLQKEKEEFISLASHQLRTPLGAMKWNLELLIESYPHLKHDLSTLSLQNQLMIDLVNRLLVILRIGDNRIEVRKQEIHFADLVRTIISHLHTKISNSKIKLSVDVPQDNFTLLTDPALLQEIISNILDNAIKYSKPGGRIYIQYKKTKTHWSISIKDQGIGIPKKDFPHIYNKFYRGSNTISISGTGLGMYIAKTYLLKLNGDIKVKSTLGKGTEMICTFPLIEKGI